VLAVAVSKLASIVIAAAYPDPLAVTPPGISSLFGTSL